MARRPIGDRWLVAGLLVLSAAAYLRCLGNQFVFDDHEMIVINRYIGQWSFLWKSLVRDSWWFRDPRHLPQSAYYRPFQDIWLALNYHLFGLRTPGWHAAMIGLHLIAVALIFLVVRALLRDRWTAALAAVFFGLIPVHTEAVVWPSAVPLPMSADFELGALLVFIARAGGQVRWRRWALALILYAGGLLSHESAVAFPGLVAIYAFLLETPAGAPATFSPSEPAEPLGGRIRRTALETAPFAALMLAYLGLRLRVLGFITRPNPAGATTLAEVLLTIPGALIKYLLLLLNPFAAAPSHRFLYVHRLASPGFYLPVVALTAIVIAGALALWERPRERRLYGFAGAWALIALVPMMNLGGLFPYGLIQDRYLYLPAFGLCLVAADLLMKLARQSAAGLKATGALAAAIAVVYAGCLWNAQHFWHDDVTLFTRCAAEFPESPIWHNRLGMALGARGDRVGAVRQLEIAHRLNPTDGATLYDLGLAHERLGMREQAVTELSAGLKRLKNVPPGGYIGLARAYAAIGAEAKSAQIYAEAAKLPGGAADVAIARAQDRLALRDGAGAERILAPAAAKFPGDARIWSHLGLAAALQGRYTDAIADYRRALKLKPDNATLHALIGAALHKMGRDGEALTECRRALKLRPNDPAAAALMAQMAGRRR